MIRELFKEKGATFLEMMVIIVIMGFFVGLTLPAFEKILASERLRSTARIITLHLREVQQQAIAQEETLKIVFTIGDFNDNTDAGSYYRVQAGTKILERKILPAGVRIVAVSFRDEINDGIHNVLNFYPLGTATPGRIVLKNRQGDLFYVIVNSVGRVRTSDVPPVE